MKDKENPNQDQNKIINKNVSTIRKYVPIDVMVIIFVNINLLLFINVYFF